MVRSSVIVKVIWPCFYLNHPSMPSSQCLLFESKVHVGKSVSSYEGVHRLAKWKRTHWQMIWMPIKIATTRITMQCDCAMQGLWLSVPWKEGQLQVKSESLANRGAESELRPGLQPVGEDRFTWSLVEWSWVGKNVRTPTQALSRRTRQQSMILAEKLCIVPKTLKDRKKGRVAVWR